MNTFNNIELYTIYYIRNQNLNQKITLCPDKLQIFKNNMLTDMTINDLIISNINVKYEHLISINAKIISNCNSNLKIIMNTNPQQIITITKIYSGINNINIYANLGIYDNFINIIHIIEDPICNNHIELISPMYIRINIISGYDLYITKYSPITSEALSSNVQGSSIPTITSPIISLSNNEFFQNINILDPFRDIIPATIIVVIIIMIVIVIFKIIDYYKHK